LQRVIDAIEHAKTELNNRAEHTYGRSRAVPVDIVTVEREDVIEVGFDKADSANDSFVIYEEAEPEANFAYALHETPTGILADMVEKIVFIESPIHLNEVITRLRSAWGLQRAGARIESAVIQAAQIACRKGKIYMEHEFFIHKEVSVRLRNRQNVLSAGLRKPELIAPIEIASGAFDIVSTSLGATEDEIITSVSRMLGFKSTSSVLRKVISDVIEQEIKDNHLKQQDGLIVIGDPASAQSAV